MQRKIIYSILTLAFTVGASAQVQEGSEIRYQNQQNVNAKPSGAPQQQVTESSTTTTVNEKGQTVRTTTEVQKLDPKNNGVTKTVDYSSMGDVEKFWNVPNETIRDVKRKYEEKERVIRQDISPARCDNKRGTVTIGGNPGNDFPVIRLDSKNISTILMTDVFGKPWSIDYIINQETDVSIVRDEQDPNVSSFSMMPLNNNAQGNFVVKLHENPVPIVFSFVTNQKEVDCLVVAKLDQPAPNTDFKTETLQASAMDNSLNSTLFGVTPPNSKPLKTSTDAVTAWMTDSGDVILRMKYKLLSPAPKSMTRSPDGMNVYRVQYAPNYMYRYNDLNSGFTVTR